MTETLRAGWPLIAGATLSLVSACAFQPAEPALMYRLSVVTDGATEADIATMPGPAHARAVSAESIELMPLRSNRPQGGSLSILVAMVGEVVRVDAFSAGRWEEAPETVIDRALVAELKRYTSIAPNLEESNPALSRPRLRPSLDQFELVEPSADAQAYAAIALSFQLVSPRERMVIKSGEIQERELISAGVSLTATPVDASQLDAIVLAFNRATSRAVARLTRTAMLK